MDNSSSSSHTEKVIKLDYAASLFARGNFSEALQIYERMDDKSAKVLFNIGRCFALKRSYESAIVSFKKAIRKDPHLIIAYFEIGNAYFNLFIFEKALNYYEATLQKLGSISKIDYLQLGLDYVLDSTEVVFNISICHDKLGNDEKCQRIIQRVAKWVGQTIYQEKCRKIHNGLDPSIRLGKLSSQMLKHVHFSDNNLPNFVLSEADFNNLGYINNHVFSSATKGSPKESKSNANSSKVPSNLLCEIRDLLRNRIKACEICQINGDEVFRPPVSKLSGLGAFNFLGKANVILATNHKDIGTGFAAYRARRNEIKANELLRRQNSVPMSKIQNPNYIHLVRKKTIQLEQISDRSISIMGVLVPLADKDLCYIPDENLACALDHMMHFVRIHRSYRGLWVAARSEWTKFVSLSNERKKVEIWKCLEDSLLESFGRPRRQSDSLVETFWNTMIKPYL